MGKYLSSFARTLAACKTLASKAYAGIITELSVLASRTCGRQGWYRFTNLISLSPDRGNEQTVGCLSSGLEPSSPGKDEARRRFVIVAVLGNLDDFLMYFSIVVSLHFCWWEFILGTTIGAICIATALGTCLWCSPRLADKVASLPLVPVVVIMAIYIAVQAFVPAMNPSPRNSAGAC